MTTESASTGSGRRRVGVVGSGVSGLTAGYVLQRCYDVSLYETDSRLGGHAHTHDVVTPDSGAIGVDTGFIVHNTRTYPYLLRLLGELGIATQPTEMSMSIHCDGCGLEYAGARGLGGLFAQPRSLARPAYLRMLLEVKRFHRHARRVLAADDDSLTLGGFLAEGGYSAYFVAHFMVPVVSCVWSTSPSQAGDYPARYLFAFLDNHGFLSVTGSPPWRIVVGGSRSYVDRVAKGITSVRLATGVRCIRRNADGIEIRDVDDSVESFDKVVIATHADTALSLLADPTAAERAVLSAFRYSRNDTVLHTDTSLLPSSPRARAAWNYRMPRCSSSAADVVVSYDMNRLQQLPTRTPYVVSLGAGDAIDADSVVERMVYEHPIYDLAAVAAQRRMPQLADGCTAFAGSYHGWGFHDDGCRSGVEAARSLGVDW
jgi:predicted NAD/FAD-binding protein